MTCIFLAAGHFDALFPLTEKVPLPLLTFVSKPMIDWALDDLYEAVDLFIVITNHEYVDAYREWAAKKEFNFIIIIDNGRSYNCPRRGALYDIQYVFDKVPINDDVLILGGDCLVDFSLCDFLAYAVDHNTSCTMRYKEDSLEECRRHGISQVNREDLLTAFDEKPEDPQTHWCTPFIYFFKNKDIKRLPEYMKAKWGKKDTPGHFIEWIRKRSNVYSMLMPGKRYHIEDMESYKRAKRNFHGINYPEYVRPLHDEETEHDVEWYDRRWELKKKKKGVHYALLAV
ncbi:MAG: hypothetical protein IKS85_06145, partial [Lachnospiraceae bacterium]|nr:hypothetical protein [Lachnospiraceae bacterium]